MNIFGIGAAELVIIFLILLVVAGPKRMVAWAYIVGRELSKLRVMWSETMEMIQTELEEAGVEEVKELRNLGKLRNFDLNQEVRKALEEPPAEGEKKKPAPKPTPKPRTKPTASEAEEALSAAVLAASPDDARPAAPHPEARAIDADAPSGEASEADTDAGSDSGNGVADATDGGPASEPAPEPEPEPEDEAETPA
ncbi:MAG: hypothetical protein M5R40_04895 [Anaerolineae bacterium]|nr:hypothetical protein [Anaerolineae bacterium]